MNCQDKVKLKLDPVYRQLIMDLTISYLSDDPPNFVEYASSFFNSRLSIRESQKTVYVPITQEIDEEDDGYRSHRESIRGESYNPEEDSDSDPEIFPKTDLQRTKLDTALKTILFFRFLNREDRSSLMKVMLKNNVLENDIVINEGDIGDFFYIIDCGNFEAFTIHNENRRVLKEYNNEGYFGELALLHNTPRAVSVQAKSNGILWALNRTSFHKVMIKAEHNKIKNYINFIEKVPVLKCLTYEECLTLADCLISIFYKPGERIISEGEVGDGMYFLMSGNARITTRSANVETEIKTLTSGDYFGELALITKNLRAASVSAINDVHVAFLPLDAFERLLGPCIDIMKRNFQEYDGQLQKICQGSFQCLRRSIVKEEKGMNDD